MRIQVFGFGKASGGGGGVFRHRWLQRTQTHTNPVEKHERDWRFNRKSQLVTPAATAADPGLPRLGKVPWNKIKKAETSVVGAFL